MRSRLAESSAMPSLRTCPNSFHTLAYFSPSSLASFASRSSTRRAMPERIASISASACNSSRETLSGRSLESTTPLMKRRYIGRNWSASSRMNTRLT